MVVKFIKKFIEKQETNGILSSLGLRTTLSNIPLVGDKFMPEMHLKQPGFTYGACGPFTKGKERIQKIVQIDDRNYIYKNDLEKACFQHHTTHRKYNGLTQRTASDEVLRDKGFNITKNSQNDRYKEALLLWFIIFLIKCLL